MIGGIEGDTRSLDYSSHEFRAGYSSWEYETLTCVRALL